ncbi:hypothetical protein F4823DRAFT_634151 [Ustulina deusta]|nr:hypothetical protein F4823DRAFT_634151 [Ustulina deusta]
MATAVKPAILIVHGGWHVPKSYGKLAAALESSGFEVHIPALPSVKDVRPPEADLESDTAVIRCFAEGLIKDGRTVGPDDDMEEVDEYLSTFTRWNAKCMYQPIQHAAWREIPMSYIYATNDMTVPFDYQKNFVENLVKEGREVQTFELASGHCPNFTATDGVVNAIEKVVSG